jgi:hypothetical protein
VRLFLYARISIQNIAFIAYDCVAQLVGRGVILNSVGFSANYMTMVNLAELAITIIVTRTIITYVIPRHIYEGEPFFLYLYVSFITSRYFYVLTPKRTKKRPHPR